MDKVKYVWCPDHGRKRDHGKSGMYMPEPHDHNAWQLKRDKATNEWKEKQKARKDSKRKAPDSTTSTPKLNLDKSFHSALTTQVMLSDAEAQTMVNDVMAGKYSENKTAKE